MGLRTVAIIGGGPAGACCAEKLALGWGLRNGGSGGHRVLIFEEKLGWEKPCGGGLTYKALRRYPFLAETGEGGKLVHEAELRAPTGAVMRFHLRSPLAVYSRVALNGRLLRRAVEAGAELVADRIHALRRISSGWELEGRGRTYQADFIVLAAGARTRLRHELAEDFAPRDLMLTFGYFVPERSDLARVQFYKDFEGYAWAFPRPDHLSVGICGKVGEDRMAGLRERLLKFMQNFGYSPDRGEVFSHLLPALSTAAWGGLKLRGQGWALAGDSAGLVDPVTGEGIYYALRSGEMLAEALLEGLPEAYPERAWEEFGHALALGTRIAKLFYYGNLLGSSVTARMVEFGARSSRLRDVVQDLMEGAQSYPGLVARLCWGVAGTLLESGARS
jgi:flavin-dependent dehydrogenase